MVARGESTTRDAFKRLPMVYCVFWAISVRSSVMPAMGDNVGGGVNCTKSILLSE